MDSLLVKVKHKKDIIFLSEFLKTSSKVSGIEIMDEKEVEKLEEAAMAKAIKAGRKNKFVSKSEILHALK